MSSRPPDTPHRPRRDLSQFAVRNLLLLFGGLLLAIAATVFAVVSWGHPSIRAATLTAITAGTLASPWALARRRLNATAETIALIGLALLPLDAYVISWVFSGAESATDPATVDGDTLLAGGALTSALIVGFWAGYGKYAPLQLPRPTALAVAQLPLPLLALAAGPTPTGIALALCGTAAFDLLIMVLTQRSSPAHRVAVAAGAQAGAVGTAIALAYSLVPGSTGAVVRVSGALVFAAALATALNLPLPGRAGRALRTPLGYVVRRERALYRDIAQTIAGVCLIAALASPAAAELPGEWFLAAYAGSGIAVLVLLAVLPLPLRPGVTAAVTVTLAISALVALPSLLRALSAPFTLPHQTWGAATEPPTDTPLDWVMAGPFASSAGPVVTAAIAAIAATVALFPSLLRTSTPWLAGTPLPSLHRRATAAALAFAAYTGLTAPLSADLSYRSTVAVSAGVAVAVLGVAVIARDRTVAVTATVAGCGAGATAAAWSLADSGTSIVTLGVLLAVLTACSIPARTAVARAAAAAGAVLLAGGLTWAFLYDRWGILESAHWGTLDAARATAFALLALRAGVLLVMLTTPGKAWRNRRPSQAAAFDGASDLVMIAALGHAAYAWYALGDWTGGGIFALALAMAGVLAAGAAEARGGNRARRSEGVERGPADLWWRASAVAAWGLAFCAPLPLGEAFFSALTGPYAWVAHAWDGSPGDARAAVSPLTAAPDVGPALIPVLLLAAAAAAAAAAAWAGRWAALGITRVVLPVALTPVPLAADLPYWAALAFLLALTAGLAAWALASKRDGLASGTGGAAVLWVASLTIAWSLAERPATIAVLAVVVLISAVITVRGRRAPEASAGAAFATLALGGEGAVIALAGGLPQRYAAFVVLVIGVMALRSGVSFATPLRIPVQIAGAVLLLSAAAMTAGHPRQLALVLALGSAAAVVAARGGRHIQIPIMVPGWVAGGLALFLVLPTIFLVLVTPGLAAVETWEGTGGADWGSWTEGKDWPGYMRNRPVSGVVAAIVAGTAVASARALGGMRSMVFAITVSCPLALLMLPPALELPYPAVLGLLAALTIALCAHAARATGSVAIAAGIMALYLATQATGWSLALEGTTLGVLGGVFVLAAAVAATGRAPAVRAGAASAAVLAMGGVATAAPLAAGLTVAHSGFAVLAVAGLTAFVVSEVRHRRSEVAVAAEVTGCTVAGAGVIMASGDVWTANAALAAAGLLGLGTALRHDRRNAAFAGLALLQFALWSSLYASGVTAPEAYTVTLSAASVILGWWLRRVPAATRDQAGTGGTADAARTTRPPSSWAAYGPGLALTFGPSLCLAWAEPQLTRALALILAGFAVTLAGAWFRLQAPLLLGGATLVLVAAHELGPALADLVGNGPRWAPIAVCGLALLFTGATYEHRIRDLRRLHRTLARMR